MSSIQSVDPGCCGDLLECEILDIWTQSSEVCRKVVDAAMIDKINILRAALDAMAGAASAMPHPPVDYLLVDGPYLPPVTMSYCIILCDFS